MKQVKTKMNEESQTVLDRSALKQLRKERKLLKKDLKRKERQREYDKKQIELKLGPKDQHITIISRDIADTINKPSSCTKNSDLNRINNDNNFPELNSKTKSKSNQIKTRISFSTSAINEEIQSTKVTKTTALTINLTEILTKPKPVVTNKSLPKEQIIHKYDGNCLDSSKPKRCKGKHKEISKPKRPSKFKSQIIDDLKHCDTDNDNSCIINVCNNLITDELNNKVKEFLNQIVRFQENLYKRDPLKAIAKRRYVTGFREVKKFLCVNKIKCLIIAPNIKNVVKDGALHKVINELISLAIKNNIPYLFALSQRKIGQITLKNSPISCVGIFYYDGAEEVFNNILQLLENLKKPIETNEDHEQKFQIANEMINVISQQ